jgi:hypothetical protein
MEVNAMHKPTLWVAALALTSMSGLALAQPAPDPGAPPPGPQAQAPAPPGPPGPGYGRPGMMEGHGAMMRGWHRAPPSSRAASFHFERGDAEIHIRCAEGEATRACVDAAVVLLDKLGSMPMR